MTKGIKRMDAERFGATREEMLQLLRSIKFTKKESRELKKAMGAATRVFGYAGRR